MEGHFCPDDTIYDTAFKKKSQGTISKSTGAPLRVTCPALAKSFKISETCTCHLFSGVRCWKDCLNHADNYFSVYSWVSLFTFT